MAVTGKVKTQQITKANVEYRKLHALNYSMLKVWDENPSKFFEEFKLGRKRKDKPSLSTIVGDIAHFFVLDCGGSEQEFDRRLDEKFAQVNYEVGSGQMFILANYLFDVTEENMTEEGNITMDLADRFQEAYDRIITVKEKKDGNEVQKYLKGKDVDKAWDLFEKDDAAQEYFKAKLTNIGKIIVSPVMIDKGKYVGNSVLKDEHTAHIFMGKNIHTSFPIEWMYDNSDCSQTLCKSELDLFKVDDRRKKIYLYDLKTTWDNEGFEYGYLKNYYYIQQAYYYLAAQYYFTHIEEQYADYEIVPMQYVVADTSLNNRRPLIFPCTQTDLKAGLHGFKLGYKEYKGVYQLMDEICWSENNGIWNMSKEAHLKKGVIPLNFEYQINEAV